MNDYDVIVVGAGGAGLAAAIEAAEAGASVAVFEAGARAGGSTALSAGVVYAGATSVQREAGISDSVEQMFNYYMIFNQWNIEPWLVKRFCVDSGPAIDWLLSLGVRFPVKNLYIAGVDDVPRGHQAEGGGAALFEALYGAASSRGIECHTNIRVESLMVAHGQVVGIRAQGGCLKSGSVVIACGGIGVNADLLAEFYPQAAIHGTRWTNYFGAETNQGDGLKMGRAIGAAIVGAGRGLLNGTPGFFKREVDGFLPSWLMLVNLDGRRFMDETAPYSVTGDLIRLQRESRCFAIMDEPTRLAARPDKSVTDKLGLDGYMAYNWVSETLQEQARKGVIHVADTLQDLGRKAGIHSGALQGTAAAYNNDVDAGVDRRFFKKGKMARIMHAPFYAVEVRPAQYGITGAGLRIDPDAQVWSVDETRIPGLYAAGESSGGVFGDRYVGGGNSIGNAIIFGRIAGRNAAAHAASVSGKRGEICDV
jgi:fumarate reductase flavoprotein subunit